MKTVEKTKCPDCEVVPHMEIRELVAFAEQMAEVPHLDAETRGAVADWCGVVSHWLSAQ